MLRPRRVDANARLNTSMIELKRLREEISTQKITAREIVLDTLSTGKSSTIATLKYPAPRAKGIPAWEEAVDTGLSRIKQLFGGATGNLSDPSALVVMKLPPSERSYHSRGTISIAGPGSRTTTATIHEMGHWLEFREPRVQRLATEFLNRRTAGQTPKWLGRGYGRDEVFVKDNFFNDYMGKIYPLYRSTEITSMGLEYLMKDPTKLLREDPEYFNLMIQILRGA